MHLIAWIITGLISGFIASKIVNKTGEGFFLDILLGIVGGVVGGGLFRFLGVGVSGGLNIPSIVVAAIGAVVVLLIVRGVRRIV